MNRPPDPRGAGKDPPIRILLPPGSPEAEDRLRRVFPQSLFRIQVPGPAEDLAGALAEADVVLLDLSRPRMDNRSTFEAVRASPSPAPVVVFGGRDAVSTIQKFLGHGAFGCFFLEDPADLTLHVVRQAAHSHKTAREYQALCAALAGKQRAIQILEHLGEAATNVFDTRRVLDLTVKVVRRALDCETGCLFLVETGTGQLVETDILMQEEPIPQLELWDGEGKAGRRSLLAGIAQECAATGDLLALDAEGVRSRGPESERAGVQSLLAVPLSVRHRTLGVLLAVNKLRGEPFNHEDREILQSMARQTAFAFAAMQSKSREQSLEEGLARQVDLATSRLQEKTLVLEQRLAEEEESGRKVKAMAEEIRQKNTTLQAMVDQFRAIHDIGQTIGTELENDRLIKRIITVTASLLKAETVSLMLKDKEGGLRIEHAVGLSPEVIQETRIRPGEGIAGWVAEEGDPILVRDVRSFLKGSSERSHYRSDSLLCVPLKIKGKVTGVVNVTNRVGDGSFQDQDLTVLTILGSHAAIAIENARLYSALRESYFNTIRALVNAVEAKDSWTADHSENVTNTSLKIADYLGLSEKQKEVIRYAGVLHDIGKIVISSTITDKPSPLTPDEWEKMKEHPLIGQRILDPIDFLEPVKICIQTHHERCDGSGYPFGLSAHEIPLETRIISVADAFDAMIHCRPYRKALTLTEAMEELRVSAGTQFDPVVVESLTRIVEAEGLPAMGLHLDGLPPSGPSGSGPGGRTA